MKFRQIEEIHRVLRNYAYRVDRFSVLGNSLKVWDGKKSKWVDVPVPHVSVPRGLFQAIELLERRAEDVKEWVRKLKSW